MGFESRSYAFCNLNFQERAKHNLARLPERKLIPIAATILLTLQMKTSILFQGEKSKRTLYTTKMTGRVEYFKAKVLFLFLSTLWCVFPGGLGHSSVALVRFVVLLWTNYLTRAVTDTKIPVYHSSSQILFYFCPTYFNSL